MIEMMSTAKGHILNKQIDKIRCLKTIQQKQFFEMIIIVTGQQKAKMVPRDILRKNKLKLVKVVNYVSG